MKIIDNIVIIDLKTFDKKYLIVNSLNGFVDTINIDEQIIIEKWRKEDSVSPKNNFELHLFDSLVNRGYIMEKSSETKLKGEIISYLVTKSQKQFKNCQNIGFLLTYNCNFTCNYCYEKKVRTNKSISLEMLNEIFKITPHYVQHIDLFGGEPLLLSNYKIIERIIEKYPKSKYSVITNGYYLEEYFQLFRNLDIKKIQITIDGEENYHNKSRSLSNNSPTYEKIMKGVLLFLQRGINIRIRMNLTFDNVYSCIKERDKLKYLFSDYISSITFEYQPLFQYSNTDKSKLYEIINHKNNTINTYNINYNHIDLSLPQISQFIKNGTKIVPVIKPCNVENSILLFDPNGFIYSCMLAVGIESRSVGKYYPDYYLHLNSYKTRSILTIQKCKKCNLNLICGGGCPNGIDGSNFNLPYCAEMLYELHHRIPELYKNYKQTNLIKD